MLVSLHNSKQVQEKRANLHNYASIRIFVMAQNRSHNGVKTTENDKDRDSNLHATANCRQPRRQAWGTLHKFTVCPNMQMSTVAISSHATADLE